jgi:integrase
VARERRYLSPSTLRIYSDNFRLPVYPELGDHQLAAITTEVCDGWLSKLRKKQGRRGRLAPASVHQAYRTLHRVLEIATRTRRIGRNPLDGIEPPKVSAKEMRFLSHDELAAIADEIGERYRALVLIAGYCGLRLGELRGLRRRDVNVASHDHRHAADHRRPRRRARDSPAQDEEGPSVSRHTSPHRRGARGSPG